MSNRWSAFWIWPDNAQLAGPRLIGALRTEVTVDSARSVDLRIATMGRYALHVNGVEVARGPMRANPRRAPVDTLTVQLQAGRNVLGVLVTRYVNPNPWWMPAPYGTDLVEGAFVLESLGSDLIRTGADWTGTVLTGWGATEPTNAISGRGCELIDTRNLPSDWSAADGADPGWAPVHVRHGAAAGEPGRSEPSSYPGGQLGSRPITWPTPVPVPLAAEGDSLLAERVVAGVLRLDVEGPAGSTVLLSTAELLDADGQPAPNEHDTGVLVTCDGTRRTVDTLDIYGLRGGKVTLTDGAVLHSATMVERLHPVTGNAVFSCSDPLLETIYAVGRRSVSLCSMDAYLDCPTREQRAWTGDSVIHQMVDLTTNNDWSLARWNPRLSASPRADGMLPMAVAGEVEHLDFTVIPDWALHWIHAVWNLYRYVGDRDEVAGLMHVAEGVLRWFERYVDDQGTPSDVTGWVIIDWAAVYTEGVSAALSGLWGRALLEFAEISDWLGDAGRARWARDSHARLAAGFERLWDPARNRYVDSYVAGARRPMASQHSQAAAIVGGLVPQERLAALVEVMTDREHLIHAAHSKGDGPVLPNSEEPVGGGQIRIGHPDPWWDVENEVVQAQPFFRYVVHDALVAAGRGDLVAGMLRDWSWALERCESSWTETWYGGTVSHGWSSTPTRDLVQRVLGVTPGEPGFAVVNLAPELGDLEWAKGVVPSPHGDITVEVTRESVTITSPVPIEHRGDRYEAGTHTIS